MARNCWTVSKVACSTRAIAFVDACCSLGAWLLAPFQMGGFFGSRERRVTGQRCACLQVGGPSRFMPRDRGVTVRIRYCLAAPCKGPTGLREPQCRLSRAREMTVFWPSEGTAA